MITPPDAAASGGVIVLLLRSKRDEMKEIISRMPSLVGLNVTIINWRGSYALDDLEQIECNSGLYMVTGREKYEKKDWVKYFGITEKSFKSRLKNKSHPN